MQNRTIQRMISKHDLQENRVQKPYGYIRAKAKRPFLSEFRQQTESV